MTGHGIRLMARFSVTRIVTNETVDCTVNRNLARWVRGIVSVGLNAIVFVYAVKQ